MKKTLALILALCMVFALCACGAKTEAPAPAAPAEDAAADAPKFEKMTLKFACSAGETSTWVEAAKYFGDMVAEKTGGAVTVEYYPSDQLTAGSQTDGIQACMDGTTELSMHSNLIYSSFDDRFSVVSLPFLFATTDDADAVLDGAGGDALQGVLGEYGLHCMGIAENGFRHVTNSKREVKAPADMKDLVIRVAGSSVLMEAYGAWGANYTKANWSEVYTGLQTGTYDGQENPLPTADGASIQEVNKYCANWTGIYDCIFFTMNKELYDSLSPELQQIVDECGAKAAENQRNLQRAGVQEVMDKWTAAGVTITELSDDAIAEFKAATEPMYSDPEIVELLTQDLIDAFTA